MIILACVSGSGSLVLSLQCVKGRLFFFLPGLLQVLSSFRPQSISPFQASFSRVSSLTSTMSHKILPSEVRVGK